MADNQISRMDVQFAPFSAGFCPATLNDFGTQLAKNLIVTPGLGFSGINIGPVAPQNTSLPWFNTTLNDWFYYSTIAGAWVALHPTSVTGEVRVGTVIPWDGQISLVNQVWGSDWLFADGSIVSRLQYPDYFAMVGTKWNVGDGTTTFGIIDARDCWLVGANQDVAGQASTLVSDGVTPTTQRPYKTHVHGQGAPSIVGDGKTAGNSYTDIELDTSSDAVARVPTRVLPPYKAIVPIVRVK